MAVRRLHGHYFPLDSFSNGLLLFCDCCLIIACRIPALLVCRLSILELVKCSRALCSYYLLERVSGAIRRFDLCFLQLASASFVAAGHFRLTLGYMPRSFGCRIDRDDGFVHLVTGL